MDNSKKINFATTYQQPIHARLNGQPVVLLACGDVEGQSPSFQYVDQLGKIDWASASQFTVTDQRAVPEGTNIQDLYESSSRQGSSRETAGLPR